jgi:hypothetical protein
VSGPFNLATFVAREVWLYLLEDSLTVSIHPDSARPGIFYPGDTKQLLKEAIPRAEENIVSLQCRVVRVFNDPLWVKTSDLRG